MICRVFSLSTLLVNSYPTALRVRVDFHTIGKLHIFTEYPASLAFLLFRGKCIVTSHWVVGIVCTKCKNIRCLSSNASAKFLTFCAPKSKFLRLRPTHTLECWVGTNRRKLPGWHVRNVVRYSFLFHQLFQLIFSGASTPVALYTPTFNESAMLFCTTTHSRYEFSVKNMAMTA